MKLLVGVPDVGTGAHTILAQIAAEVLTIRPEELAVEAGDTSTALFDSGSGASRVTRMAGKAVEAAATRMRGELCQLASELMGWPEGQVELKQGRFEVGDGGDGVAFQELAARAARASGGRLEVREVVVVDTYSDRRTFTAQVAEVAVDPETGEVTLRRLVSVHDIGYALNPMLAEGQVEGGAVTGLGYALLEDLRVEAGRSATPSLGDYKLPCVQDVPEFRAVFLESDEGPGPYGGKAVGEVSTSPVAPAVANAIFDAVGVRISDLPITAEKVHRMLHPQ